jgi:hypothetical protein
MGQATAVRDVTFAKRVKNFFARSAARQHFFNRNPTQGPVSQPFIPRSSWKMGLIPALIFQRLVSKTKCFTVRV